MKINPNCFALLEDFFITDDQFGLLRDCFDLTEDDWEKAFELISDFGCSKDYEEQFERYYQGWKTNPSNFMEPTEWVDELEAELKKDKSEDDEIDIEDDCQRNVFEWYESFSTFSKNIIEPLQDIQCSLSSKKAYLDYSGVKMKLCFDDYKYKNSFIEFIEKVNKESNSYQTI